MKHNKHLFILSIVACLAFGSCKKESKTATVPKADVTLSVDNTGSTVTVTKGQTIAVTLGNPGDGNYYFDPAVYTSTILSLNGHVHTDPPATANNSVAYGNYGTDTWVFTAITSGEASIKITASQPKNTDTAEMFNSNIVVK